MNPFYNSSETRLRAGVRILFYIVVTIIALMLQIIPDPALGFILAGLAIYGVYMLAFKFIDQRDMSLSGLQFTALWLKEFVWGIVFGMVAMSGIFITEWLSGDLEVTSYSWENSVDTMWVIPVLIFFVQMLSVGFYEEIISRGYLVRNLTEGFSFDTLSTKRATIIAVAFSSSLFGFAHVGNPNATLFAVLNIILAGVMLAIPFVLTGRLALSIGIHFAWNFFQGGVFGFAVSGTTPEGSFLNIQQAGNPIWTGGNFGPEGGIIGIMGMLLIIVLVLIYAKLRNGNLALDGSFQKTYLENKESLLKTDELA